MNVSIFGLDFVFFCYFGRVHFDCNISKALFWNGILIDGYNRYQICNKHGLEFATKEMSFESRNDAEIWMIRNQKGRRNVSTFVMVVLGLKLGDLLRQKGLKNKSIAAENTNFKIKERAGIKNNESLKQNSAKASDDTKENQSSNEINNFVNPDLHNSANMDLGSSQKRELIIPEKKEIVKTNTREEIAKFANTSHFHLQKSCTQNKSLSFRRIPVLKG